MAKVNLNELAREISDLEGGKKNLSIAQIKEVINCLGKILRSMDAESALSVYAKLLKAKK